MSVMSKVRGSEWKGNNSNTGCCEKPTVSLQYPEFGDLLWCNLKAMTGKHQD